MKEVDWGCKGPCGGLSEPGDAGEKRHKGEESLTLSGLMYTEDKKWESTQQGLRRRSAPQETGERIGICGDELYLSISSEK